MTGSCAFGGSRRKSGKRTSAILSHSLSSLFSRPFFRPRPPRKKLETKKNEKSLSASKVVILGSRCLAAEVSKNLVLAGIGGVTLIDDSFVVEAKRATGGGEGGGSEETRTRTTTAGEAAASGNFLVAAALAAAKEGAASEGGESEAEGASKINPASPAAEAAAASLREMNPHVSVSVARFPSISASSSSCSSSSSSSLSSAAAAAALCPGELAKFFEGAAAVVYACGLGGGSGRMGSEEEGGVSSSKPPLLPFASLHAALAADAAASAAGGIPFFWGGVAGSQGFFFVNLHEHEFEVDGIGNTEEEEEEKGREGGGRVGEKRKATAASAAGGAGSGGTAPPPPRKAPLRRRAFASLERLLSHPWAGLHPRRTHGLVYGLRTVFEWEARRARQEALAATAAAAATQATAAATTRGKGSPLLPSASDLPLLLEAGHFLAQSDGVAPHALPAFADDGALALLARDCDAGRGRQHPSVAAIVGGALANDVVRAVSKKGVPAVDNLFCFSLVDGKGVVERLGEVREEGAGVGGGGRAGERGWGGGNEDEVEDVEVV